MSDFADEQLNLLINSIELQEQAVAGQLKNLLSPILQVEKLSNNTTGFIDQVLDSVAGNEDMIEVNKITITALAQLKNFMLLEPNRISVEITALRNQQAVYNSCLESIQNVALTIKEHQEEEIKIGNNDEILEGFEELSQTTESHDLRKIGNRPEALRKIRQEMFKNLGEETPPEDI